MTYTITMTVGTKGCGTIIDETLTTWDLAEVLAKVNELKKEWDGNIVSMSVFENGRKIA